MSWNPGLGEGVATPFREKMENLKEDLKYLGDMKRMDEEIMKGEGERKKFGFSFLLLLFVELYLTISFSFFSLLF